MKVWHKIMVAPGVAIIFLMVLGVMSYSVLTYQNSTIAGLFNNRFANYQIASGSAQDISEVHSNVYRLFTWLGNLKEDKIDQITAEQKAKIDEVTQTMTGFAGRSDIRCRRTQSRPSHHRQTWQIQERRGYGDRYEQSGLQYGHERDADSRQ